MTSTARQAAVPYLRKVVLFHLLWVAVGMSFDLVRHLAAPTESFFPAMYVAFIPVAFAVIAAALLPISVTIGAIVLWATRRWSLPRRVIAVSTATAIWAAALAIAIALGRIQFGPGFPLELALAACLIYGVLMPLPRPRDARGSLD